MRADSHDELTVIAFRNSANAPKERAYFFYKTTSIYIYIYTECPGVKVPDFGRMFVTLKYTDITQNTYIRS